MTNEREGATNAAWWVVLVLAVILVVTLHQPSTTHQTIVVTVVVNEPAPSPTPIVSLPREYPYWFVLPFGNPKG
jgi:hypothetical protein